MASDDLALADWLDSIGPQESADDEVADWLDGLDERRRAVDELAKDDAGRKTFRGIHGHEAAVKIAPQDRPLYLESLRRQLKTQQTMGGMGFGGRLAASVTEGLADAAVPMAKMIGSTPQLDADQVRFRDAIGAVYQGHDPQIQPDTPVVGQWTQKAARMAYPMTAAVAVGGLTGGAAAGLGAGPLVTAAAGGVGVSGTFLPQTADDMYTGMIAEGVSPANAKKLTAAFAPLEAAIESFLPNPFRGMTGALQGTTRQVFSQVAKQWTKNYTKEMTEEVLQGITRETAMQTAAWVDENVEFQGSGNAFKEAMGTIGPTLKETAGPLAVMMAPGGARMVAEGAAADKVQKLQQRLDTEGKPPSRSEWAEVEGKPREEAPPVESRREWLKRKSAEILQRREDARGQLPTGAGVDAPGGSGVELGGRIDSETSKGVAITEPSGPPSVSPGESSVEGPGVASPVAGPEPAGREGVKEKQAQGIAAITADDYVHQANVQALDDLDQIIESVAPAGQGDMFADLNHRLYEMLGVPRPGPGTDPLFRIGSVRSSGARSVDLQSDKTINEVAQTLFDLKARKEGLDPQGIVGPRSGLTGKGQQARLAEARAGAERLLDTLGQRLPSIVAEEHAWKIHKTAVTEAIKEGKFVPPEVLADYPDLAKRKTQALITGPQPTGREGVKQPRAEDLIRDYARDNALDPDDLLDAAETAHQGMKEEHESRRAVKRAAHKRTGLSGADMRRLENSGHDFASETVGGKTGQKMARFDVYAAELVSEHQEFFGSSKNASRAVWDLLREPATKRLRLDDPNVMQEAEAMMEGTQAWEFNEPDSPWGQTEEPELGQKTFFGEVEDIPIIPVAPELPPAGKQGNLFATKGLPGQKNLFDDAGVPDDMVAGTAAREAQQAAEEARPDVVLLGSGPVGAGKGKGERFRQDVVPEAVKAPNEEVERRMQKAKGLRRQSWLNKIKDTATIAKHVATRAQEHIPNTAEFASANEFFRLLKNVPVMVQDEAIRTTAAIIDPLGPQQLELFSRAAVVDNQLAALEMGQPLRFGFGSKEEVESYRDQLHGLAEATPEVKAARETRRKVVNDVVDQLVEFKLLPESTRDNADAYYHQQVHFYMEADRQMSGGGTRPGKVGRTFQRKRVQGESLDEEFDYNTSYIEAEAAWLTDAMMEIEKERLFQQVMQEYNIRPRLQSTAKRYNFENLVGGPQAVARIRDLEGQIKESLEVEGRDSAARLQRKIWIEELEQIDPTRPFKVQHAKMSAILRKRLGIVDESDLEEQGRSWWGTVKWAADQGDPAALAIFKNLHAREAFIEEELGSKHQTWQSLADAKEGHEIFQPEPGNAFYQATTVPDRIVEQLQANVIETAELSKEDLRQVLVMGQPHRQFVIPSEVAKQMETAKKKDAPHGLAKLSDEAMKSWKVWTLLNPKRAIGYNLRNLTGDLDPVIAANPSLLSHTARAMRELKKYHGSRLALSDELRTARDLGVVSSGFAAEEIPDVKDLALFQRFFEQSGRPKTAIRPVSGYFDTVKKYTEFRENTLRYAAFLSALDQVNAGKIKHYGGSRKPVVDQLKKDMGNEVAAAHLARNLLGDYGNITVMGDWIRHRLMPFWSFQEINLKRVPRLVINAWEAGQTHRAIGALSKSAASAILMSSVAWMYGGLWAWNNLVMPGLTGDDDEGDLPPYDRANPHVLLGRNPDGTVRVFRNVGALGDFLEWFGLNEAASLMPKYRDGQIDAQEIVKEMALAPLEKAAGSIRPDIKGGIEVGTGMSLFPEPFQPRSVRRGEAAANVFGLADEYKQMRGMVLEDGNRARPHYWQRWGVGVVDPRQTALSEIYELRNRFLKAKGQEQKGVYPVSRYKEARDAAKNEDYAAFAEWRRAFVKEFGGYKARVKFRSFLRRIDPIAARLSRRDEFEFEHKFLTSEQRGQLQVARQYAGELRDRLVAWNAAEYREETASQGVEQ